MAHGNSRLHVPGAFKKTAPGDSRMEIPVCQKVGKVYAFILARNGGALHRRPVKRRKYPGYNDIHHKMIFIKKIVKQKRIPRIIVYYENIKPFQKIVPVEGVPVPAELRRLRRDAA
jgi:hypothetical protein